jgi:hypothetical protein
MLEEVVECVAHESGYDHDCEHCVTQVETMFRNYQGLCNQADAKGRALAKNGVSMDPLALLDMKIDMLLSMVLNPKVRATLELAYMTALIAGMEQSAQEANRAKLTSGVPSLADFKRRR